MAAWYYGRSGQSFGPFTKEQMRQFARGGQLLPGDMAWAEGMAAWQPAGSVPDLFSAPAPSVGPPPPMPTGQRCHEVDFEIFGDDMQLVEIELDGGETIVAEAGAMNYMDEGITFEARFGDGSRPDQGFWGKMLSAGKRALTGESLFLTHFTNSVHGTKKRVAFAAPYPGKIIPINLAEVGFELTCQKDAFLCAAFGTELTIAFTKKIGVGLFGGEGFILQKLKGDGKAFVHACGAVREFKLQNRKLYVDTGCLVAFTPGIDYSIERAGNLKSMFLGGEGLFLATLSGAGTVWVQSLPFGRLAARVLAGAITGKEEGSILPSLFER